MAGMILFLTLIFSCLAVCAQPAASLTDDDIKTMLRDHIDVDRQYVGVAIGIVDEHGPRVVCHGRLDNGTDRDADGDTLHEIGSITKVFTALLLQDMVERGEMKLDDPVQKYLPDSVRMPTFEGKEITLLHLATHTSGLPRDSDGDLYSFLSNCKLQQSPGTRKEYSNLGVGLLGHIIALKAGKDYETLVIERICEPLGMNDTRITVPAELKARLAAGHAMPGHRVRDFSSPYHDTNALAPTLLGAGSIRSTANDLLKFVSAYAGLTPSPLSSVMQKAMEFHSLESGEKRPLVWESDDKVFEHGGLTRGFKTELAFDVKTRRGVVVLSNCRMEWQIPADWKKFLEGRPVAPAHIAQVDQTLYDNYAGLYQFGKAGQLFTVRHDGSRLVLQQFGTPSLRYSRYWSVEVFPQSPEVFQNNFYETEVRFIPATTNQPLKFVLTSLGPLSGFNGSFDFARISKKIPLVPAPIPADPVAYEGYVGKYRKTFLFGLIRVGPTLVITHKQDALGSYLFASVSSMGTEQIVPTAKNNFIAYDVEDEIRLTFVQNKKGKTSGVNILWNGRKLHGTRISSQSN